jgi:hypothetical protein
MVALAGRPEIKKGTPHFGLCVAVDKNGVPYLTNEAGDVLAGVRSFNVYVEHNGLVTVEIKELLATRPKERG